MTRITYFPRYTQKENFVTNNTLLLMHRLYDDNRRRFQRFLGLLLEDKDDAPIGEIGLRITQQVGTSGSVLDGYLHQPAVRIAIETKLSGVEFDVDQLLKHLEAFETGASGYLILLRPNEVNLAVPKWRELNERAAARNIVVTYVSFEKVIDSFRQCLKDYDETMLELIDDYEAFCSEQDLLNTDKLTIFVPPCGQSFEINKLCRLYFCPADWSRRKVRYIGIYKDKSVQYIGEIKQVIRAELGSNGELACEDESGVVIAPTPERVTRIKLAIKMASQIWDISHGHKFFLCDKLVETSFRKTTPKGIFGHRYLNLGQYLQPGMSIDSLADTLKSKTWE